MVFFINTSKYWLPIFSHPTLLYKVSCLVYASYSIGEDDGNDSEKSGFDVSIRVHGEICTPCGVMHFTGEQTVCFPTW